MIEMPVCDEIRAIQLFTHGVSREFTEGAGIHPPQSPPELRRRPRECGQRCALQPGAYSRPPFRSTKAFLVDDVGWFHGVLVSRTAQLELTGGRVCGPASCVICMSAVVISMNGTTKIHFSTR